MRAYSTVIGHSLDMGAWSFRTWNLERGDALPYPLCHMLPDRKWNLESVLMLFSGLMISIFLGMCVALVLKKIFPHLAPADERFFVFIISTVSFQGVALLLTHRFLRQHEVGWREFLGLDQAGWNRVLWLALGVAALALPVALLLNALSEMVLVTLRGKAEMQPTMKILELTVGTFRRVCFGFTAVLLAPVVEEILFRGLLYPAIKLRGYPKCALIGTSLLFAAIHGSLMTLVPLFFLAVVFVWLYERTGTLAAPIAAHSFFNTVNFFIFIYRTELEEFLQHLRERI